MSGYFTTLLPYISRPVQHLFHLLSRRFGLLVLFSFFLLQVHALIRSSRYTANFKLTAIQHKYIVFCSGHRMFSNTYSYINIVQCYGVSTTSDPHQLHRVTPLKTPFRLLIGLFPILTRNYIHSQLFITLCHIYKAYYLTRLPF
jgi:hypothetical protein